MSAGVRYEFAWRVTRPLRNVVRKAGIAVRRVVDDRYADGYERGFSVGLAHGYSAACRNYETKGWRRQP